MNHVECAHLDKWGQRKLMKDTDGSLKPGPTPNICAFGFHIFRSSNYNIFKSGLPAVLLLLPFTNWLPAPF